MVCRRGGSASFERLAKVHLFLWVAFTNNRLGATAPCVRDRRCKRPRRQLRMSQGYLNSKFVVVRARRVVLGKFFPHTSVGQVVVTSLDLGHRILICTFLQMDADKHRLLGRYKRGTAK